MKRKTKRILAFLFAVVLTVTTVLSNSYMKQANAEDSSTETTEVTPVTKEGFTNLTISDFVDSSGAQMSEGVYSYVDANNKRAKFYAPDVTNFDKVLLSMYITFGNQAMTNYIDVGGISTDGKGLVVCPNSGGNLLFVDYNGVTSTPWQNGAVELKNSGVDSFINNEFLLQMSFEYGDFDDDESDTSENDVKIGVYINGVEYCDSPFIITNWDTTRIGNYLSVYRTSETDSVTLKSVEIASDDSGDSGDSEDTEDTTDPLAITLPGFLNVSVDDFVNSSGAMEEKTYAGGSSLRDTYYVPNLTNFDKVLLSMYVEFGNSGGGSRIEFGGTSDGKGYAVWPNGSGNLFFYDSNNLADDKGESNCGYVPTGTAGVSTFKQTKFLLQVSFEYGDYDDGGTVNDVKLGVYINGDMDSAKTFTIYDWDTSKMGNYFSVYRNTSSDSVTIGNVKQNNLAGYDVVTISDFQDSDGNEMEAKRYEYSTSTETFSAPEYANTTFDNTVLSMNLKFESTGGVNTRMNVGGADGNSGVWVYPRYSSGSYDQLDIYATPDCMGGSYAACRVNASDAGLDSFLNTKFQLQLTFNFVNVDSDAGTTDLLMHVYINGALCGSNTFTDCTTAKFGNCISLLRAVEDSVISVGSIDGDFPYKEITFYDFGIWNKTYEASEAGFVVNNTTSEVDTFAEVMLTGDILLDCSQDSEIIWGGTSSWKGLEMVLNSQDGITLNWRDSGVTQIVKLDPETAGVTFRGEKYKLGLSAETVDNDSDGKMDDLKIGIWFEGNLYNSEYFYIDDKASELGNYFSVYCKEAGDNVTFNSDKSLLVQPDESYEEVTFFHYGIDDGTYTNSQYGASMNVDGSYIMGDSIDKTVLCGDILLTKAVDDSDTHFSIILGGTSDNIWDGIRLWISSGDNLFVNNPAGTTIKKDDGETAVKISPSAVGLESFFGEEFNLMWSTEIVDHDNDGTNDVKIGLWINGILCEQTYYYCYGYGDSLGNRFGAQGTGEDDTVTLNSIYELTKLPDKSFDKVTFSDFGIENGEYTITSTDNSVSGNAGQTLDKVVFSGDIRIADSSSALYIYYGGLSDWNGLRFYVDGSGRLQTLWYEGGQERTTLEKILPSDAGDAKLTKFVQQTFNLMISTELGDFDGEGDAEDIKICLWFNEVRYTFSDENGGNDYLIVYDQGDNLGDHLFIYTTTGIPILLRSDAEYQKNPYYYADISEYRQSTGYKYPTLEGYVFSGWYEDEDYTTPIGKDVTSTPNGAYAKFVEEEVLSVKTQVEINTSTGAVPTDETDIRFVTTVDSLEYRQVSFFIKTGENEIDAANLSSEDARVVYEKLYYLGATAGSATNVMEYKPTVFSWMSDYFKTFTLWNIPASAYDTNITVTPYWITLDGTTVRGIETTVCVNDYKYSSSDQESKAVSFDFLGEDSMPITGYYGPYSSTLESDSLLLPDFVTDEYVKMIADSGVNVIICSNLDYASKPALVKKLLKLGEKYGVGIYVQDSTILDMDNTDDLETQLANYSGYESFIGMYLVDEPNTTSYSPNSKHNSVSTYETAAKLLDELGIKTYINLYPIADAVSISGSTITELDKYLYKSYIDDVRDTLKSQVVSWDYYPFTSETVSDMSLYFWNMDTIRTKAKDAEQPFWAFVQAGAQWNDDGEYFTSTSYYPDEYQFNWNVNTCLAYGAQGIQYFPLVQPINYAYSGSSAEDAQWDFNRNSLLGAWGNKTDWYTYAEAINKHIGAIDEVLMNSVNEGVIVSGTATTYTSSLSSTISSDVYSTYKLKSVSGNTMIGCFDYNGKTALYVVNYNMTADGSQDITLEFTGDYAVKVIQDAETNKYKTISSLTLNMEAGEGVLLVIE